MEQVFFSHAHHSDQFIVFLLDYCKPPVLPDVGIIFVLLHPVDESIIAFRLGSAFGPVSHEAKDAFFPDDAVQGGSVFSLKISNDNIT
ncbi:hypothetical protein SDC9_193146 [bioreactor metagenome]|uniref:Uncharacterized protein n=1 Tax=bioreactor metagenome TaxID=1076179 RepID=A0A645I558_9ZZZZ